ncbi:hypothetical protein V8E54_010901 [Elaphomyces granulatus]
MPEFMSELGGLRSPVIHDFKDLEHMKDIVCKQLENFSTNSSKFSQYIVFRPVSINDIENIDEKRRMLPNIRLTYYAESELLVVKLMSSCLHEVAHRELGREIEIATGRMGLSRYALCSVGGGRFDSPKGSKKEGDTCYVPLYTRRPSGWPTLVLEVGVSESLPRLRNDASWWLSNSDGEVKVVLLIEVDKDHKRLNIETWEIVSPWPDPTRHDDPSTPAQVPALTHLVSIGPPNINDVDTGAPSISGAPLKLDFGKVFLRAPTPPAEKAHIELSPEDLSEWARILWLFFPQRETLTEI